MAFVCTLSSQTSPLPVVATFRRSLATLVYPIGYDDEDGRPYRLMVSFGTAPGGIIEYSFCIVCSHNNGVVHDFWDSKVIANMIPRDDRRLILALLLDATTRLVRDANFPEVTMHTFAFDLPPKALVKYRHIAQVFRNEGYGVRETVRRGQYIWWFERETGKTRTQRRKRRFARCRRRR